MSLENPVDREVLVRYHVSDGEITPLRYVFHVDRSHGDATGDPDYMDGRAARWTRQWACWRWSFESARWRLDGRRDYASRPGRALVTSPGFTDTWEAARVELFRQLTEARDEARRALGRAQADLASAEALVPNTEPDRPPVPGTSS